MADIKFALFFLAEYVNILAVSSIATTLFLGGGHGPYDIPVIWYLVKVAILVLLFYMGTGNTSPLSLRSAYELWLEGASALATLNLIITSYFLLR